MSSTVGRSTSFWTIRYGEARTQAILVACISWVAAAVIIFGSRGDRDLLGHLKGADFVHFYTLGRIVLADQTAALYDADAQHRLQADWVPASAPDFFLPVYPPQTALLFTPFARLSYGIAALLWAATTIVTYTLVVRSAWRPGRDVLPDSLFIVAAAAGFAPFWSLVLHGQTTTVPLLGFCLGWQALERNRRFLAGLALGLVAIKPQLGLALTVVIVACGEWAILSGLLAAAALQTACVWFVMGPNVLWDYFRTMQQLPRFAALLEPKPYQLHSIRAITRLVPGWWESAAWVLLSLAVVWRCLRAWKAEVPVAARMGVLVLASVLVSPHLTVYDATVLVLPILWLGTWIQRELPRQAAGFWPFVFWLYVTLLIPTAVLVRVQVSVLVLGWLFVNVTRRAAESQSSALPESIP